MKGNNIDDLFREKLSHQKLTPPPAAWAAVEVALPEKKKKGIYFWISMAASILLICTLGWIVLGSDTHTTITTNPSEQTASKAQEKADIKQDNVQEIAPKNNLQADNKTKNDNIEIVPDIKEPAPQQLVASHKKATSNTNQPVKVSNDVAFVKGRESNTELNKIEQDLLIVLPLNPSQHLSVNSIAQDLDFSMVMPLMLTDYFTPYNEDIQLAPKKKRFRVLNGIISIAKEVNSSKLSFSELRNAKNSFVNDELKYGSKSEEDKGTSSEDEDMEDDLNKD